MYTYIYNIKKSMGSFIHKSIYIIIKLHFESIWNCNLLLLFSFFLLKFFSFIHYFFLLPDAMNSIFEEKKKSRSSI